MSEKVIACGLTLDDINGLADKVNNGSLSKIKIVNGASEIIIEKESKAVPMPAMPPVMNMVSQAAAAGTAEPAADASNEAVLPSGNVVKAPIVGTFYAAPAPDKAPFVTVGQQVKKGDVIMIIESMKLMNEVTSEFDGTVKEILVENGNPVEFDQPVMIIE
ncbi:MAG: acetyl-CoA carboxylase biotin carboxyl carrier protein [Oscillospiraceae bacterium]|nr:acetyl-CoA carboxylase biotin carboxyl carrier protein [Oscillospiraceae bacterium]